MIGYLSGTIIQKSLPELWISVGGVGYRVTVANQLYSSLEIGQEVKVFIHTAVREDAITLFGFKSLSALELFEVVISVSGIGPKIGLSIIEAGVESVKIAVRQADVAFFQRVKGVGKKSAQRIIVDLKGKLPQLKELDLGEPTNQQQEVVDAMVALGYKAEDVLPLVQDLDPQLSLEEKIKAVLRNR